MARNPKAFIRAYKSIPIVLTSFLAACGGNEQAPNNTTSNGTPSSQTQLSAQSKYALRAKKRHFTATESTTSSAQITGSPTNVSTSTTLPNPTNSAAVPSTNTASNIYYVDSQAGNDTNDGRSPVTAWKTLDKVANESANTSQHPNGFAAGDQILFRRGQVFTTEQYPIIKVQGTADIPVIIGAWGDGSDPQFDNTGPNIYDLIMKISGQYATLNNLSFIKSNPQNITEAAVFLEGQGHRITASDFSGVGIGVYVTGIGHRIDHSHFHDLTMVIADSSNPYDDYGAEGLSLSNASNISVDHNKFENLRAYSPDFGVDGSVIEIYNNVRNLEFHHNVVSSTNALTEIGGNLPNNFADSLNFHHNLVINCDSIGYFHNDLTNVSNVHFDQNTLVKDSGTIDTQLLGFAVAPGADQYTFRNNIVSYRNSNHLFYNYGQMDHENNLYSLYNVQMSNGYFSMAPNEFQADPLFRDASSNDFHLSSASPAIDRGMNLGNATDLDDLPAPVGAATDIGAYEAR